VDEIGEWLRSGGAFVEIGPFATERIRRDYTLGLELVVTHGATKLDLPQRCHGYSSYQRSEPLRMQREYLCHGFEIDTEEIGLVESLGKLYLLESQKPRLAHHPATGR
jgi:hypothetical protein